MPLEKKPIATIVLKNRSGNPIVLKRDRSSLETLVFPLSAMGLKVYRPDAFLAINWDERTVTYDFGSED